MSHTPTSTGRSRSWVELRIHGVSGTPPEVMLESAHVVQVAGDSWGRFFRPADGTAKELQRDVPGLPPHRVLEGYHWGKYTSGSLLNGLWLLLIPFGLVNAAAYMVPDPGDSAFRKRLHAVIQAIIRGLGLAVTGTFAMASGLILVDLLAMQWAVGLPWLQHLHNGWVVAAGVAGAAVAPLLLFVLGNENRKAPFDPTPSTSLAATTSGFPEGMTDEDFFRVRTKSAPTLGRFHLTFSWCFIAFIGCLTWRRATTGSSVPGLEQNLYHWLRGSSLALIGLTTLLVLCMGDPNKDPDDELAKAARTRKNRQQARTLIPSRALRVLAVTLLTLSALVLVLTVGLVTQSNQSFQRLRFDSYGGDLAGITAVEMIVLAALLGVLAAGTTQPAQHPEPFRRYARGMAAWAASCVGVFLGVGFCAAFVLGLAKALKKDEQQSELIRRIGYTWGLTVLVLLPLAVAALLWVRARSARRMSRVAAVAYRWVRQPNRTAPGDRWPKATASAMSIARLKWYVAPPFLIFAIGGLALTIVMATKMLGESGFWFFPALATHLGPAGRISEVTDPTGGTPTFVVAMTNVGIYSLLGLAALLFYLGRRSVDSQQTRRFANVAWDVISFWPHSAHPFVPPAYSQFTVNDLRRRIRHHLGLPALPAAQDRDTETVSPDAPTIVLSAHSQGSLIALTTLLWLSEAEREHVRFVTYGSQLQVAYPRGFPAFVDFDLVSTVKRTWGRRWVNLYRETDPIAGPVLSWHRSPIEAAPPADDPVSCRVGAPLKPGKVEPAPESDEYETLSGVRRSGDDWRVLDPPAVDAYLQSTTLTQLSKHSGYPASPDYLAALRQVLCAR